MIDLSIHKVEKIELLRSYPMNGNSRTLRITTTSQDETTFETFEITFYGETDALDTVSKAPDYRLHLGRAKAEAA